MTTSASAPNFSMATPDEVLAYIPHALGFYPRNSVVLLILQQAGLCATLRVDLPLASHGKSEEELWVRQMLNLVQKVPRADGLFIVFYTGATQIDAQQWPPRGELLKNLAASFSASGLKVRDGWHVGTKRWHSYFCMDARCCPTEGFPLPDLALTETHLRMVLAGSAPATQLWDGGGVQDWENKDIIRDGIQAKLEGISELGGRESLIASWADLLGDDPAIAEKKIRFQASLSAALLASLHDKTLRDLLPYLAGRGEKSAFTAMDEILRATEFGEASQDFSEFLLGTSQLCPDWERLERLWYICRDLLGIAAGTDHAALLCLLGWIEWAKGRGSSALALFRAALRIDNEYRLAQLLMRLLETGEMPLWVADPVKAWHRKLDGQMSA
ncbi:DUF4192 domain-containing protein [Arthrobacter sp. MYb227]|uniref:DUF4192 domain-containing protein n=1 Tax=Arthrobacter sp. MYb227 TaxID=1848601 RepID=UPI0015E4137B|nr:DUF4192 domain-containing protein [Arthrobacter sp. MYb227]